MKKLFYIIFFFLPVVVFPQWTWQNPLPQGNDLTSVHFADANTGYSVGNSGTILKTIDGGVSWTLLSSGTNNRLESVFFCDVSTGFAVGENGIILKSTDGGTTWVIVPSGKTKNLNSVFFCNCSIGYIAGNSGTVLKTIDGGGYLECSIKRNYQ